MYIYFVNLRIQSEYRKIRTRKNSVFGHFSRSDPLWAIPVDARRRIDVETTSYVYWNYRECLIRDVNHCVIYFIICSKDLLESHNKVVSLSPT